MQAPYTAPVLDLNAFHCPSCGAYARQHWDVLMHGEFGAVKGWRIAICSHCNKPSIWFSKSVIYPSGGSAPLPNSDLPADIRDDYEEARAILNRSPRGAAALLRLAVQKLCKELGEPGANINQDIAALAKKGLLPAVQQSLDAVRVIGNNAVHPGQIDLQDTPTTAGALFSLVNLIADQMITAPAQAGAVYRTLPPATLAAIAKRDDTTP